LSVLYFDCFSGASGDMILGALIDAGVPLEALRSALGSLAVDHDAVWTERVRRAGLTATKLNVRGEEPPADHVGVGHQHHVHHGHEHSDRGGHRHEAALAHEQEGEALPAAISRHHEPHRSLAEIYALIDRSSLAAAGKTRAKELFQRLGEVEAGIHGTTLEKVHLHEVGALDSIIDIVGAVFALEWLGADKVVCSPLNVGGGTIRSAHGVYPVPAPATARLLQGAPIYSGPQNVELVTPTGALIVSGYARSYGPVPPMRLRAIGYGAGSRDFPDTPNVLRVLVGDEAESTPSDTVVVIEAEIDDMNPQIFGLLMDRLLTEGALDVFYTAIQMKKNRPGTLLTVVAAPGLRERLTNTIFRETTTIGVRYREMARECLTREIVSVETPFGVIRFKVARQGSEIVNASPEFDDCVRAAEAAGKPLKDVQAAAIKAYMDRTS
jgi:uncharacterized protein (TIGR00299 family) protein